MKIDVSSKCVECGCSYYDPCIDPENGKACGWVRAEELPKGQEGPLCTFCLEILQQPIPTVTHDGITHPIGGRTRSPRYQARRGGRL